MKTESPSDFLRTSASGVVRASNSIRSEWRTREIQTFWPLHDVTVALAHGRGLELGRVGAGRRLGDGHRLQAQVTARDLGQVFLLLAFVAVAHEHVHHVHLAVAGAGVAAAAVDLLHDHGGFGEAEARAAVFVRDQRREPARLRERVDEFRRVAAREIDLAEVLVRELGAERAHAAADFFVVVARTHM